VRDRDNHKQQTEMRKAAYSLLWKASIQPPRLENRAKTALLHRRKRLVGTEVIPEHTMAAEEGVGRKRVCRYHLGLEGNTEGSENADLRNPDHGAAGRGKNTYALENRFGAGGGGDVREGENHASSQYLRVGLKRQKTGGMILQGLDLLNILTGKPSSEGLKTLENEKGRLISLSNASK